MLICRLHVNKQPRCCCCADSHGSADKHPLSLLLSSSRFNIIHNDCVVYNNLHAYVLLSCLLSWSFIELNSFSILTQIDPSINCVGELPVVMASPFLFVLFLFAMYYSYPWFILSMFMCFLLDCFTCGWFCSFPSLYYELSFLIVVTVFVLFQCCFFVCVVGLYVLSLLPALSSNLLLLLPLCRWT